MTRKRFGLTPKKLSKFALPSVGVPLAPSMALSARRTLKDEADALPLPVLLKL